MHRVRCAVLLGALAGCANLESGSLPAVRVQADAIDQPLTSLPADSKRGREVFAGRDGNCLLCHAVHDVQFRFAGKLAPALDGVGTRLSAGQLRLRIADSMRLNPDTIMPSYYRVSGLNQVGEPWRGKPILTAQQIEDVLAYLLTLR